MHVPYTAVYLISARTFLSALTYALHLIVVLNSIQ